MNLGAPKVAGEISINHSPTNPTCQKPNKWGVYRTTYRNVSVSIKPRSHFLVKFSDNLTAQPGTK